MTKMKKLLIILAIVGSALNLNLLFSPSSYAYAECQCDNPLGTLMLGNCEKGGKVMLCDESGDGASIRYLLALAANVLLAGMLVGGTIGMIVCGYTILTARDDTSKVEKAKQRLFDIVIGLVVFVLMWGIAGFIMPNLNSGILNVDTSDMNKAGSGWGRSESPTSPSTPEDPSTPSTPGLDPGSQDPAKPSDPDPEPEPEQGGTTPSTPTAWNTKCGPDPNASINKSVDGKSTVVYRSSTGRTFYHFKQGDDVWGSMRAGENSGSGSPGTMSGRGCYRTSIATVFRSFGLTTFTPANLAGKGGMSVSGAVKKYPDIKNYLTYNDYTGTPATNSSKASDWKQKIISTLQNGGAVIFRIKKRDDSSNDYTSSQHSMPLVDYRKSGGKDQVYIANTVKSSSKSGWKDLDYLLTSKKVNAVEIITFLPKDTSLKCK